MTAIYARDRIVVLGDSITAGLPNPWWTPLQAACTAFYTNLYGANSPRIPQWFNLGVVADTAALVLARIGQVHSLCPTLVFNQVVINDCSGATANASFQASYDSIMSQERTHWPQARLVCMGALLWQEDWPSGANPFDTVATGIEAKNDIVRTLAATYGAEYVDMRAQYTKRMPGVNPGHAQQGIWTLDKVHPTLAATTDVWSLAVGAQIQFQPQDFPIVRPWGGG